MALATYGSTIVSCSTSVIKVFSSRDFFGSSRKSFLLMGRYDFQSALAVISNAEEIEVIEIQRDKPRYKWLEVGPNITETQKNDIARLRKMMTKRCTAFLKQIICYDPVKGTFSDLLAVWVRYMKPIRADWLMILKELNKLDHPRYFEIAEWALEDESFEANIRDYTKIIHGYGKQNRVQDAENIFIAMKKNGFICDQVTLTAMVDMYSKTGNLKRAEDTFEEMKLLGQPMDKKCFSSMIMAYIKAGFPQRGEALIREMDALEIYAGSEVYKALLRTYSMNGDAKRAQSVFDAIQFAGIPPDSKFCALLINVYSIAGESEKAYIVFKNMIKAGLEPNDKCVALVLDAYEKENKLSRALDFLMDLEKGGTYIGKEGSNIIARWFSRLGLVKEDELVLSVQVRTVYSDIFHCKHILLRPIRVYDSVLLTISFIICAEFLNHQQ